MKKLIVFLTSMWTWGAWAEVSEVRLWEPAPGRTAELYKVATDARAIQKRLGATVSIGTDQTGTMHYAMTFPDWATWGAFQTALQSDKDWAALLAKFDVANPSGTPAGVFFVTTPVVAKTQAVSLIASWDVDPGKTEAFLAQAQPFVTLDTKLGGSVGLNIDALGDVHYEVTFDSMTSYGKFIDAIQKSTERAELTRKASEKPIANLVKFYIVEAYTGP